MAQQRVPAHAAVLSLLFGDTPRNDVEALAIFAHVANKMAMRQDTVTIVTAALLGFCLSTVDVAAKEPLRLAPSSPWNLHYGDDSCSIGRSFGEGDDKVVMVFSRYEPGDMLQLNFTGKPTYTVRDEGSVTLRFGPHEAEQKVSFFPASSATKIPALIIRGGLRIAPRDESEIAAFEAADKAGQSSFRASTITREQEAAVTFVEVSKPVRRPFVLDTGSLASPLAALRKCTDELLDHWGIDVAKHANLMRPAVPKSDYRRWVQPRDYPPEMIMNGKRAIVHFRLNIGADGKPTACHIQQSTRPKAFDDAVCRAIMRNAEFEPALDADGAPLASYWRNTAVFIL
ncbi:MAG: energy transducer TonB [Sphingopyxis solisilvae]|uniref:energy transducer TonB n=1 Tax=Sphingopyxis solisilvae TaxID=1886788 RepID=UPI0040369DA4